VFGPFEPQAVDPAFIDRMRQRFGVLVFEGVFKLEVADHLAVLVQQRRQAMATLVRHTRTAPDGQGFRFIGLQETPEYVKSVFHPLLRDLIEFAANRFSLEAPSRYTADIQVRATLNGGGSVPFADTDERGGKDRRISWIYFIPSSDPYQGGELVLYEAENRSHLFNRLTRRILVPPAPNTLILFPSTLVHEITPVFAPRAAGVTRPTIQGWLRWTK